MELINYSVIAALTHLEIKEALHVFLGATNFSLFKSIVLDDQQVYLGRDKIGCLLEYDFPSQNYKKKFKKNYDKLLSRINALLETGLDISCWDIKALRPVSDQPRLPLEEQMLYLWKTEHLINWALMEGIVLPRDFQAILGIQQVEEESIVKKAEVLHLCLQALAQVIWYECSFGASHSQVIENMRNIVEKKAFDGSEFMKYCPSGPLDYIISEGECKYFREEKQNIIRDLLKKVDPRPPQLKKRRANPIRLLKPFSPKLISGVFSSIDISPSAIDFKRLKIVLQTIGFYLFGLRKVADAESALEHPLILTYIANRGNVVKSFAYHCLITVCPERAYLELCKKLPKKLFDFKI